MSLVKKSIGLAGSSYLVMVLGIGQVMILSRALGSEGVGQLVLYRQTFLFSFTLASLGLPMAMIYRLNRNQVEPGTAIASVMLACGLMSVLAVVVTMGLLLGLKGRLFDVVDLMVLAGCMLWIPTCLLRAVLFNYQAARQNVRVMVLVNVLPPALLVACYAVMWVGGWVNVSTAVVCEALIMGGFSFVLVTWLTRPWVLIRQVPPGRRIDWGYLRRSLPQGIQLVLVDLFLTLFSWLSLAILKLVSGDSSQVGYYSRGVRLATIISLAVLALQRLLYANWASLPPDRRARSVEKTVNFALTAMLVFAVFVLLFTRPLTLLLFGHQFLPSVPVTRIVLGGVGVYLVVQLMLSLFNSDGKSIYNVYIIAAGVACNAAGGLLLAPVWLARGSAVSLLISYLVMTALAVTIGCRRYQLRWQAMFIPSPKLIRGVVHQVLTKEKQS